MLLLFCVVRFDCFDDCEIVYVYFWHIEIEEILIGLDIELHFVCEKKFWFLPFGSHEYFSDSFIRSRVKDVTQESQEKKEKQFVLKKRRSGWYHILRVLIQQTHFFIREVIITDQEEIIIQGVAREK